MNINIEYNNIYGNPKYFVSEIIRYTNESNIDITVLSYQNNNYLFIKNVINMSVNRILLMISKYHISNIFTNDKIIQIFFIITNTDLLEIIHKFEHYPNIILTILILNKSNEILHRMRKIKYHTIIDTSIKHFNDIINIINNKYFDFIFTDYTQLYLNTDEQFFATQYIKEIQILGTIGTLLFINNIKSTLFVLHPSTSSINTIKKYDNSSISHIDTLFLDMEQKIEEY
jgi:hypothetical protein